MTLGLENALDAREDALAEFLKLEAAMVEDLSRHSCQDTFWYWRRPRNLQEMAASAARLNRHSFPLVKTLGRCPKPHLAAAQSLIMAMVLARRGGFGIDVLDLATSARQRGKSSGLDGVRLERHLQLKHQRKTCKLSQEEAGQ